MQVPMNGTGYVMSNTMNPNMPMFNNTMGNSMSNTMNNGMNDIMYNGTNMNTMGNMNMGLGMSNRMNNINNMNNMYNMTSGGMRIGNNNTMGERNTMVNQGLTASMNMTPLGLTATGNNGRAGTVDGLVDQTYLQLSGEASQITQKWRELQYEATDLQKKKVDLRRQWNEHRRNVAALEDEKRRFKEVSQAAFAPKGTEMRVRLNVGGQMFETTASTLTRDAGSMLDALCRDDSPLAALHNSSEKTEEGTKKEADDTNTSTDEVTGTTVGVVFIDRDGKLFRYVLNFLRDGVLPQDKSILRSLYREAKYYEIKSLCVEIEKRLGIVALLEPRTGSVDVSSSNVYASVSLPNNNNQQWWERPSDHRGWWPSQRRGEADMSWWTGDQYRGQSTTNVLRSYDANGVGTTTRDSNRYGSGYGGRFDDFGSSRLLRRVDATHTTWDTMGRGLSRRPYDDLYGNGERNTMTSGNNIGRYSGLRASGGATRFR